MRYRRPICLAGLIVALGWLPLATPEAAAQKIHRWTGKDGKIHFSNIAPAGKAAEEGGEPSAPDAPEIGIVREAPTSETEPQPRPAPVPEEKQGPYSSLSEEQFSTRATEKRLRCKREVSEARRRIAEIDQQLARIREKRNQPFEQVMRLAGATPQPDSPEEEPLEKDREKAEKRIEQANKEYAELRDEAVKRFGREPPWWLPLE